ncbi:hypothetical protein IT397_02235 [Candidatus Nomurabacteria bacterium]|nr:hypothetical protein [Candidatus Nomurabacteria bacterium]
MSVFLSFLLDPQGSCEFDKWRIEDENFQIELPITEFKFNGYFFIYYLYSKQFEKPFKLLRKDFDKHKVRFVRRHNKSYISLKTVENSVNDETKGQFENSKQII